MLLFFFFSSRRRHTRFDCDWSSDVCSSDLGMTVDAEDSIWINSTHSSLMFRCNSKEGAILAKYTCPGLGAIYHLKRSEEHTSELQSQSNLVCRLLLEKKKHQHGKLFNT